MPSRTGDGGLCPDLPPLGDVGAGQLAKMMNQICIAGLMQGLSEALHFRRKGGPGRSRRGGGITRAPPVPGRW